MAKKSQVTLKVNIMQKEKKKEREKSLSHGRQVSLLQTVAFKVAFKQKPQSYPAAQKEGVGGGGAVQHKCSLEASPLCTSPGAPSKPVAAAGM